MKHHISCKKQIAALAALGCAFAHAYVNDAGKVVVGTREIMTVEVSAAETWDKPVVVCGVLRKTGAGKLTIPAEKLYGAGRIDVAEGELEITATGAGSAAFAEPTSVMSGAAMWLDASMHVAGTDGAAASGDAVAWYDVRETDWATPDAASMPARTSCRRSHLTRDTTGCRSGTCRVRGLTHWTTCLKWVTAPLRSR